MKKLTAFAAVLVIAALFERCTTPEVEDSQFEKIQFRLASPGDNGTGTQSFSDGIPSESFVQISIEKSSGEKVLTDQRVKIMSSENGYVTEAIDLPTGEYNITDFSVVDKASDNLYVGVENGSPDAAAIEHALPLALSVGNGKGPSITVNVVACFGNYSRNSMLKEFVIKQDGGSTRTYKLFYNRKGDVDSISASEANGLNYVYRVQYTKGRIDSVGLYNSGNYESVHKDFQYDQRGRIISYAYYFRMPGWPHDYAQPWNLTYDHRGRVTKAGDRTFEYNVYNDVIQYETWTYTHDKGKNPFYGIDNLFAIFVEESFMYEHIFSAHNVTSKTDDQGNTTYFNNVYDWRKRLISNQEMTFSYY